MTTDVGWRPKIRNTSAAGGARRFSRFLRAGFAPPAIVSLLAFVDILRPGGSQIATASGTLDTLDAVPEKRIPPNNPPTAVKTPDPCPAAPPPVDPPPAAGDDGNGDASDQEAE